MFNPRTRRAYYRAGQEFLSWCGGIGLSSIAAVEPGSWSALVLASLASTETTPAASAFDPSARFPSREEYCAVVQALASALYVQVASATNAFRTTFADVISHNGLDSLNVRNIDQIDGVNYVGMLVYLSNWDTVAARMPDLHLSFQEKDVDIVR